MVWDVASISLVSGFVVTVLGWSWWVFRKLQQIDMNTKRLDDLESKWDRIIEMFNSLHTNQESMNVALWGRTGDNGLRGEVKELKEWVYDFIRSKMEEK